MLHSFLIVLLYSSGVIFAALAIALVVTLCVEAASSHRAPIEREILRLSEAIDRLDAVAR